MMSKERHKYGKNLYHDTGRRRPIGSLIFIGHFPQKWPIFSGSFVENDLQLTGPMSPRHPVDWSLLTTLASFDDIPTSLLTSDQMVAYISKRDACTCTNMSDIILHSCVLFLYLHNILASFDDIPTSFATWWHDVGMSSKEANILCKYRNITQEC